MNTTTNQKSRTKTPFNLELFKQGHKAVTRDGREAEFHSCIDGKYPVLALIEDSCYSFTEKGLFYATSVDERLDLLYMQDNQEIPQPSPEPKPMKIKPKQTVLYQSIKSKLKPHDPEKWKEVKKELKQVIKANSANNFEDKERLIDCFIWEDTKQGHKYWEDVNNLL